MKASAANGVKNHMHILICNDDGYSAQGIKALTSVMERFGRVTVIAPEYNHSGASNSLTLNEPLTVTEIDGFRYPFGLHSCRYDGAPQ